MEFAANGGKFRHFCVEVVRKLRFPNNSIVCAASGAELYPGACSAVLHFAIGLAEMEFEKLT
jgi:hypothetical protein